MIEGVWSFQYKASTFISFIEMDIYATENCPYLSVGPPFSIHISPGYIFFFFFFYQKSTWHASSCVYPLQLIDSHVSEVMWGIIERDLFASLIKQLFTGAYSYNKINW